MVFVVDDYFADKEDFKKRIPEQEGDEVHFISVLKEPTTEQIDACATTSSHVAACLRASSASAEAT
jgi:hypothetical protein